MRTSLKNNPRSALPRQRQEHVSSAARPGRIKRHLTPRAPVAYGDAIARLLEDDEEARPAVESTVPPPSIQPPNLSEAIGKIHEYGLGCLRVVKAGIEFGRAAGQALADAQRLVGEDDFDLWVEKSLAISPAEARAMLRFSQEPEVRGANVSPANAMKLGTAMGLLNLLCKHFAEGRAMLADTASMAEPDSAMASCCAR